MPVENTSAPLGAVYFVVVVGVVPVVYAKFEPKTFPVALEVASVLTPAGSKPFVVFRRSHSQPTSPEPIDVDVPGGWLSRPV